MGFISYINEKFLFSTHAVEFIFDENKLYKKRKNMHIFEKENCMGLNDYFSEIRSLTRRRSS